MRATGICAGWLLAGLVLASCGSRATIVGTVQDTEGNPVSDAAATLEGTTAVDTSDASGRFSVSDAPGSYTLLVGKGGYLSYSSPVDASEAIEYDMGTIQLQATPPDKGLWLYDQGNFSPIARVVIEKTPRGAGRTYCLAAGMSEPTQVPAGDVTFFDWSQMDRHLIRMTEEKCAGIRKTSRWIIDDDLGETVDDVAEDMKMRKVKLTPGHYIYADWTNGWFRAEASYFQVK